MLNDNSIEDGNSTFSGVSAASAGTFGACVLGVCVVDVWIHGGIYKKKDHSLMCLFWMLNINY